MIENFFIFYFDVYLGIKYNMSHNIDIYFLMVSFRYCYVRTNKINWLILKKYIISFKKKYAICSVQIVCYN